MAVTITECYSIRSADDPDTTQWIVDSFETIDGIKYVTLDKKSCGFARFVTGHSLGLRQFAWLDAARGLRTSAHFADALSEGVPLFGLKVLTAYQIKKKLKSAQYKDASKSNVLTVCYPRIVNSHGQEVAHEITMRVKNTDNFKDPLSVEFSAQTLQYVREALKHGPKIQEPREKRSAENKSITWNKKRKAFIVKLESPDDNGRTYVTIRPKSSDEPDMANARTKAASVADGTFASDAESDGAAAAAADGEGDDGDDDAEASECDGEHTEGETIDA
jgi:hypothetical protein